MCRGLRAIADRFKASVEVTTCNTWTTAASPIARFVGPVGVVCLQLGQIAERGGVARKLAAKPIHRADTLMYGAKGQRAGHVYATAVQIENGQLVELEGAFDKRKDARND